MKVATAAYPIERVASWQAYRDKVTDWVSRAAADLLVFPEYGAMEIAGIGTEGPLDLATATRLAVERREEMDALFAALSCEKRCHILAPSGPVADGDGRVNRAILHTPEGLAGLQDKQIMTRYEREEWGIGSGGPLRVFETELGRIAVLICYDAEFPLLARALAEAGADILAVPSCTDLPAGHMRVRIAAMARALEGQCYVLMSSLLGDAPWCPPVDKNTGGAAIFSPPDRGLPESGIIAEGPIDKPGWVTAEISMEAVLNVRRNGQVLNLVHGAEQPRRLPAEAVSLTQTVRNP